MQDTISYFDLINKGHILPFTRFLPKPHFYKSVLLQEGVEIAHFNNFSLKKSCGFSENHPNIVFYFFLHVQNAIKVRSSVIIDCKALNCALNVNYL